jgi:hypothetical protein
MTGDQEKIRNRKCAQRDFAGSLVTKAQSDRFYGRIVLIMEDGVIRRAIREESIKPPE